MLRRRFTLFRLAGIRLDVHASWLLLAGLVSASLATVHFPEVLPGRPALAYWGLGVVALLGLAASVVAHEYAHALVARRHGIRIGAITLFVLGGVAEMEDEPPTARSELLMAIAGPALSAVLAGLALAGATVMGGAPGAEGPAAAFLILVYLGIANAALALFNLLPAFPLDGGRVLRALLWGWRGDVLWATRIATRSGQLCGLGLIGYGLFGAWSGDYVAAGWWLLLGLFVRFAAAGAMDQQLARAAFGGDRVARFVRPCPALVPPALTLDRVVEDYFRRHARKRFPVVDQGRLLGVLSIGAVSTVGRANWPWRRAAEVMAPCAGMAVADDSPAAAALFRMRAARLPALYVLRDGLLLGQVTRHDLQEHLAVQLGLGLAATPAPAMGHPVPRLAARPRP